MMLSPTSINTYLQCPRKYYYKYIKRLPTKESACMIVGSITHEVLAEFVSQDDTDYSKERLLKILDETWKKNKNNLVDKKHYKEIRDMVEKWFENTVKKANGKSLCEYFRGKKAEIKLNSNEYNVRGILDLVDEKDELIVEYKTSSRDFLKREHKLQLGIYTLLFLEKFKQLPKKLFINFLRHEEKAVPVTRELVNEAKRICKLIKLKTLKRDIKHYPKKVCPLCKWSNGQCDFYEGCFRK